MLNNRINSDWQLRYASLPVGYSISVARDADGKRRAQKRENRIFEMLPESKMTFNELTEWYLNLESVKRLASFRRINAAMANFNNTFGYIMVRDIRSSDLENYQIQREQQNVSYATIDMEISLARTMVNKAFDNDFVNGRVLKTFRSIKRKLKPGSNARSRIISVPEYLKITPVAPQHLRGIIITSYNTGMRMGEILGLTWPYLDLENDFLRLPPKLTKESKLKSLNPIFQILSNFC